ncbi:MAG: C40 family peptidase [Clostridia bacterium]|nr:C40 family peptidase [Clostridia bacterium]
MSKSVFRVLRAVLITALALLIGASALAESIEVKLNETARIYQSASTSARYVKAPKGLKVTLKAYSDGWGKLSYKGRTGYIRLKYLDRVEPVRAYVTESTGVYRDAEGSDRLTTVPAGTTVYVVGVDGSYVRIQNKSGSQTAYIKGSALSGSKPDQVKSGGSSAADAMPQSLRSTTSSAGGSKVEYTIYVAQNLLGAPYASNANPPKSFDCAKFCYYCYGKAQSGVIKSSSYEQGYDDSFARISYDNLKRGDLVCFNTVSDGDACDHTGIYLGGGYFIHASSAAKKVILSSLSSGYYKRTFSWGRRIFG